MIIVYYEIIILIKYYEISTCISIVLGKCYPIHEQKIIFIKKIEVLNSRTVISGGKRPNRDFG